MANFHEGTAGGEGGQGANKHGMNIDEGPRISLPMPPMRNPYHNKTNDPGAEHMLPRFGESLSLYSQTYNFRLPCLEVNRRPKFIPRDKSTKEILSEKQIAIGPHFGDMLRESVFIQGGRGRMVPCFPVSFLQAPSFAPYFPDAFEIIR